jgi:hypothetical protein
MTQKGLFDDDNDDVSITIMDIIHRSVFYLKHDTSETGFCLRLQVEPTEMGQIELVFVSGLLQQHR